MQVIGGLLYFAVGIVQFLAIWDGLEVWIGIPSFLAFIAAIFLGWCPLVGPIVGMFAAVEIWGWSWPAAIALFFGTFIAVFVFAMIGGALERFSR